MTKYQIEGSAIGIERLEEFSTQDLTDMCDATEATILDNGLSFNTGMNRTEPPVREILENFWKGVLLVPERILFVGRLDGVICSAIQLILPAPGKKTSSFSAVVDHHFVAPWARGHGLAKILLKEIEKYAKAEGIELLTLGVRENLDAAIKLYESLGYKSWGRLEKYEKIDGKFIAGRYYAKDL